MFLNLATLSVALKRMKRIAPISRTVVEKLPSELRAVRKLESAGTIDVLMASSFL
jgi:hypothetical protein